MVYSGREDRLDWHYLLSYKYLYQTEKRIHQPKEILAKEKKTQQSELREKGRKESDRQSSTGGCGGR